MFGKTFKTALRALSIVAPAVAIMMATPALASAAAPAASPAAAEGGSPICVPVHLTGAGQPVQSNDGLIHTAATVSLLGFPVATTSATFTPSPTQPIPGILSFSGPIGFTTSVGGLSFTADVQGSVDVGSGAFQATSTSVTGTGPLAGISGSLTFQGIQSADGLFTETIAGKLCSPLPG
jgi:hypothetical protein